MDGDCAAVACRVEDEAATLELKGAWRLAQVAAIDRALRELRLPRTARVVLDGRELQSIDTAAAFVLLDRLAKLGCPPSAVTERDLDARHVRLLALVRERMAVPRPPLRTLRQGPLQRIGRATIAIGRHLRRELAFGGVVAVQLLTVLRRPGIFRPRETAAQFETACVDAIPIVMLINFLIGVVVAYVLGVEAQKYGASLFVADGVALAVCRELAPILGSVLMAGRSGAAFTAQIGTMKVEEEVDAIVTMGLSPIQVLVVPRLFALVVTMPLLVLVGDIAGLCGGMLVCSVLLSIPPDVFIDRVHTVLDIENFWVGLGKAPVFAVVVAMIACRMGLEVRSDARSVGENTTSTVVQCIVWVIVLDALFAVIFQRLGL